MVWERQLGRIVGDKCGVPVGEGGCIWYISVYVKSCGEGGWVERQKQTENTLKISYLQMSADI